MIVLAVVGLTLLVGSLVCFAATERGDWPAGYIVGGGMAPLSIYLLGIATGVAYDARGGP